MRYFAVAALVPVGLVVLDLYVASVVRIAHRVLGLLRTRFPWLP